ncbi:MAG: hypothetical protein V4714_08305 [Bacteroidota bacterium]
MKKTSYWEYLKWNGWSYATLILGGGWLAAGIWAQGLYSEAPIALVGGIIILLANPGMYLWLRSKEL